MDERVIVPVRNVTRWRRLKTLGGQVSSRGQTLCLQFVTTSCLMFYFTVTTNGSFLQKITFKNWLWNALIRLKSLHFLSFFPQLVTFRMTTAIVKNEKDNTRWRMKSKIPFYNATTIHAICGGAKQNKFWNFLKVHSFQQLCFKK